MMHAPIQPSSSVDDNSPSKMKALLESDENEEINESCGFEVYLCKHSKRYSFPCLNFLATPVSSLFFLCLACVGQGIIGHGLFSVVVSTLEQRFHLQSSETGMIASCYDIGACLAVLFVTYIGGKGHKPSWIGWGMIICGFGSMVFALPHFVAPHYVAGEEINNICNSSISRQKCLSSYLESYRYFFVFGQLLHGIGGTALLNLGVTYLDDNVTQIKSSLYHGIFLSSSIFGPAIGFFVGGQFLNLFTNINEKTNLTVNSSMWIGAWWLGYLAGSVLVILLAFPILLLPKYLPRTDHVRKEKEKELLRNKRNNRYVNSATLSFSDIRKSLLILVCNPMYLLPVIADGLEYGMIVGLTTFGPKYLQSVFFISPTKAAVYFGIVVIVGGAGGLTLGGWIVTKMKWSVLGILRYCIVCSALTAISALAFTSTCPNLAFAGSTTPYINESRLSAYIHTASCNEICNCNSDVYDPVCGDDGVTYYSPCLAGCKQISPNNKIYFNCSCIGSNNNTAEPGICHNSSCGNNLSLFLGLLFVAVFGTFLPSSPTVQITLRVVPFGLRSLGMGVKAVFLRVIGSIPVPIVMGAILDRTCAVWSFECGKVGACQLYDNPRLSLSLGILIAGIKILIVIVFGIALFLYNPAKHSPHSHDDDDSNEPDN